MTIDPPETLAELVEQNVPDELKDQQVTILPIIMFVVPTELYEKLILAEVEN